MKLVKWKEGLNSKPTTIDCTKSMAKELQVNFAELHFVVVAVVVAAAVGGGGVAVAVVAVPKPKQWHIVPKLN